MSLGVGSTREKVLVVHGLWTGITTMKRRAANAMSKSQEMSQQQRKYLHETLALAVPLWIALLIVKKGWHVLTFKSEKSKNLFLTSVAEVLAEGSVVHPASDGSTSTLPPASRISSTATTATVSTNAQTSRTLAREDTIVLDSQPDDQNDFEPHPLSPIQPSTPVHDLVTTDDEDSQPIPTPPSRRKAAFKRPHLDLDLTFDSTIDGDDDDDLPTVTLQSPPAKRTKPASLTREASLNIFWDCLVCDQSNDDNAVQCSRCTLART
jgi:hypothetical protein